MENDLNSEINKMKGELNLKRSQEEELAYRRADRAECSRRVQEALTRMLNGESTLDIVSDFRSKYKLQGAAAKEYITKAYKELSKYNSAKKEEAFDYSIALLNKQYQEARVAGDQRLVLDITKEINKVRGLYEASKIDVNHTGKIELTFGDFNITEPTED